MSTPDPPHSPAPPVATPSTLGDGLHEPSAFEDGIHTPETVDPAGPARDPRARFNLRGRSLREHAARGTLINTAFLVGLSFLGLARGFLLAGFLAREDYGVWGTVAVSLSLVLTLKSLGVGDKYVQQDEADQEQAFQRAWTLEALLTGICMVVLIALLPLMVLLYGEQKLLAPALIMIFALPAGLLQMPVFIYYRQMDFLRQRTLQAIEPVVALLVSLGLAIAGFGYWALFIGVFAGAYAAGAAALYHAPYKLAFRYDKGTMREYWSFSWPLLAAAGGGMVIAQTSMIAMEAKLGLAGAGTLTLAGNITQFSDRVDRLVTGSLYPAICAVKDRTDLLFETFVKSNRLALMWAVPFGLALTLFSSDFVDFGIGEKWRPAVILLQVYGVVVAIGKIAFNWDAFLRARGDTRPMAIAATAAAVAFLVTGLPLLFVAGLRGFAIGIGIQMLVHLAFRVYFLRRLFKEFAFLSHALRAWAPVLPAVAVVLIARSLESGQRTGWDALAEIALFGAVTAAGTWRMERKLLREMVGYVRARAAPA